ncbi:MAG: DNA replication/repair protein RecF [Bacilli bacterium]|nr:DNA replication/repair protein RecF [Bacilli bacterium]
MVISNLILKNFRNHSYRNFDFVEGLNLITGENAVGKTNIIEAIYYLSLARSFRTSDDKDLILNGADNALIEAIIQEGKIKRKITIKLSESKKEILINNKKITKLSTLSSVANVIEFTPEDVMLFKGSPRERRKFLDIALSKKNPLYLDYISRYEKALKERNEILKSDKFDPKLLEASTEVLAKLTGPIMLYRQNYVRDINDILLIITRALTGVCEDKFEVKYEPFIEYNSNYMDSALEAFNKSLERDIRTKLTNVGIHREDFSMSLNGRDIATYGSQGENRIAALALKLSPYFLIEDEDKRPIVVLDDVMSELDNNRRENLIKFLNKFKQVFISGTKLSSSNAHSIELRKNTKN